MAGQNGTKVVWKTSIGRGGAETQRKTAASRSGGEFRLSGEMTATSELRKSLRPLRAKSTALAVVIFAADAGLYAAATWFAMTSRNAAAAIGAGLVAMVAIAMLFVVGHDACHGSLTGSARLNGWIGRLAFLPSLTPFRAWDEGHNRTHHVYTNL